MRLELTAFRLWDWRAAYCATEADASCKFLLEINCIDLFIYYSVIVIISVLSFIFSNHFFLNTLWYRYVAYMERYAAKCNENNHSTSITMLEVDCYNSFKKSSLSKIKIASAGNRTRVNCLEGSYAHHYTTDAGCIWHFVYYFSLTIWTCKKEWEWEQKATAVTRIRTWVTAATTQGPNH